MMMKAAVLLALLVAAAGCDNAYVSLSVGEWREGGAAAPPLLPMKGEPSLRDMSAGGGNPVRAGDLVKLRVIVTSLPVNEHHLPLRPEPRVVWAWTGRDEGDSWRWGHPGTESVRKALIGRRQGDRFELAYGSDAEGVVLIPSQGLMEPQLDAFQLTYTKYVFRDRYYRARRWPALDLRPPGYGPARAEVEILAICTATRFYRTGVMRQWGYILNSGDSNFRSSRQGVLHWSAIDASCPAPDGHFRVEAGPFYFPRPGGDPGGLWNWQDSYVRKRPPADHPLEWEQGRAVISR